LFIRNPSVLKAKFQLRFESFGNPIIKSMKFGELVQHLQRIAIQASLLVFLHNDDCYGANYPCHDNDIQHQVYNTKDLLDAVVFWGPITVAARRKLKPT
jgi:hypothetical protein